MKKKGFFFLSRSGWAVSIAITWVIAWASSCTPRLNGTIGVNNQLISNELRFIPTTKIMTAGNQFQAVVAGGAEPYTLSLASGRGTFDPVTGIYQAEPDVIRAQPTDAGEFVTLTATDSLGATISMQVTIVETIAFTTPTISVGQGMTHPFGATGGIPPYAFSINSGLGSINNATGVFTAPGSAGTVVVKVRDSELNEAFAFVTVVAGFGGSTQDEDLPVSNTFVLVPSGGQSPYTFAFVGAPSGTITSATGNASAYVAPATVPGTNPVQVRVTDSLGQQIIYRFNILPPVQISPALKYVAQGQTFAFSASGGLPGYLYSDGSTSPIGTINSSGLFTATTNTGSMTVNVVDSRGNTSTAIVHVYLPLQIAPTTFDWQIGTPAITFSASGGDQSTAYSWTRMTGGGSPASGSGPSFAYTPASVHATTETVRVSDPSSNTSTATIRVYAPFLLTPASVTLQTGNQFTITPSGGIPPHSFVLNAGTAGGNITSTSGTSTTYQATGTPGTASIVVTDSIGNNDTFNITVNPPLTITPISATRAVNPGPLLNQVSFSAVAGTGVPPYNFASTCPGTITAGGLFSSPATTGTCTITLSDSHTPTPNSVTANVTVNPSLALAISDASIDLQQTVTLTASGGVPPYTISQTMGGALGTFTFAGGAATTATFKANNTPGSVTFQVTDSVTSQAFGTASGTVDMPPPITHPGGGSFTLSSSDTQLLDPAGGVPLYDAGSVYTFSIPVASQPYLSLSGCTGSATVCTGQTATVTGAVTAVQRTGLQVDVSDGLSSPITISFTLNPNVQITPTTLTMTTIDSYTFSSVTNTGVPPYIFSMVSGGGSIGAPDGLYSASGASAGTSPQVRVRDRNNTGDIATATITMRSPLAFDVGATLSLNSITQDTYPITVVGTSGVPPFTMSSSGTGGSLSASGLGVSTADIRANPAGGPLTVTVTDSWAPPHSYTTTVTMNVPAPASAPTTVSISSVTATSAFADWNDVLMTNTWGSSPLTQYDWQLDSQGWNTVTGSQATISTLGGGSTHTLYLRARSAGGVSATPLQQKLCDIDYYLNAGSCSLVAVGQYSPGGTAASALSCSPAPGGGYHTSRGNGTNSCSYACNNGYGSSSCSLCAAGAYDSVAGGTENCAGCPAGTYQPSAGTTSCTSTSAGYYASGTGNTGQTACPAGTYQGSGGQAGCNAVSGGYRANAGSAATGQIQCTAGTYSPGSATSCTSASAGYYVPSAGASGQTACPAGTYQGSGGQSGCNSASAGYYAAGTGNTGQTACPAGTYQGSGGQAGCNSASAGYYASGTGNTGQTACPAGTYQGSGGQSGCNAVSGGYRANAGSAATGQIQCTAGTYSPGSATSCTSASAGYYVPSAGATGQTACPAGTYQPSGGQSGCTSTSGGYYASGTGNTGQTICSANFYCPAGSGGQTACPGGQVSPAGSDAVGDCYTPCTPVNGGWNSPAWTHAGGLIWERTKTCNSPAPSCGGSACSGSAYETQVRDCVPGDFESCVTCGPAQSMNRSCSPSGSWINGACGAAC